MLRLVLVIQGRTVVVFPRFLKFFLRFLSEVVVFVFPRLFKILSLFSFWSWRSFSSLFCWDSIWNFIICANISLRSSIFFFFEGRSFFFCFFFFSKYPQKSRIITVFVCVFCTTQTVSAEFIFSLWSRKKQKYENQFLITWQSY